MFTHVVLLALASSVSCFNKEVDEKYHNLPHDEFVKYFNSQNFSYKITHYDGIDKKAVSCAEVDLSISVPIKSNIKYDGDLVPVEYDGRQKWEKCYQNPIDQGECGSCWAIVTAAVASTRKCLLTSFYSTTPLSPLDLVCCKNCYSKSFCGGGSPEKAALFWKRSGLVSSNCKPYEKPDERSVCKEQCANKTLYYNADKYFGSSVLILMEDDHEIRAHILYGPVVATFALYEDFKDYKEGVYVHTHGKLIGYHSVQVIGYGLENGIPYWLATNTWGLSWGEKSVFKVKRFEESLGFEKQMLLLSPRFFGQQ